MDQIYSAEQIEVPQQLPSILKAYTKEVIRYNPPDIPTFSKDYFTALVNGDLQQFLDNQAKIKASGVKAANIQPIKQQQPEPVQQQQQQPTKQPSRPGTGKSLTANNNRPPTAKPEHVVTVPVQQYNEPVVNAKQPSRPPTAATQQPHQAIEHETTKVATRPPSAVRPPSVKPQPQEPVVQQYVEPVVQSRPTTRPPSASASASASARPVSAKPTRPTTAKIAPLPVEPAFNEPEQHADEEEQQLVDSSNDKSEQQQQQVNGSSYEQAEEEKTNEDEYNVHDKQYEQHSVEDEQNEEVDA